MTLRILLVDDEALALDRLQEFLGSIEDVEVVGEARDGAAALEAIAALTPDLVLLDIQMPAKTGMALAMELPQAGRPDIVFVTAFETFAPDAFAIDATDYLLKPVRYDRLRQAIARAKRRREARRLEALDTAGPAGRSYPVFLWVQTRGGSIRLPVSAIDWIEAARDYVLLHTATQSFLHRISMAALEETLDPAALTRVHRSSFVRLSLVQEVQGPARAPAALVLRDGAIVQIGPSYAEAVGRRLRAVAQSSLPVGCGGSEA